MWKTAPPLSSYALRKALEQAIGSGAWGAAHEQLVEYVDRGPVHASVFNDARDLRPPWSSHRASVQPRLPLNGSNWSEYRDVPAERVAPHVAVVLHVHEGANLLDLQHKLAAIWPEQIAKRVKPPPGYLGRGAVPSYSHLVALYRLWRLWERDCRRHNRKVIKTHFYNAVSAGELPWQKRANRWPTSDRPAEITSLIDQNPNHLKNMLRQALAHLSPDPDKTSLADYLENRLNIVGAYPVKGE